MNELKKMSIVKFRISLSVDLEFQNAKKMTIFAFVTYFLKAQTQQCKKIKLLSSNNITTTLVLVLY